MPWAVSDLPDLTGTTALVTGANSGIGSEPAAALASIQALAERGHGSLAPLVKQRGRHAPARSTLQPVGPARLSPHALDQGLPEAAWHHALEPAAVQITFS